MKSIAELTHWHVDLLTFWHFLCTIKHLRYESQLWLIQRPPNCLSLFPFKISAQCFKAWYIYIYTHIFAAYTRACIFVCMCAFQSGSAGARFDWHWERTGAGALVFTDGGAWRSLAWRRPLLPLSALLRHCLTPSLASVSSLSASWQQQTSWAL